MAHTMDCVYVCICWCGGGEWSTQWTVCTCVYVGVEEVSGPHDGSCVYVCVGVEEVSGPHNGLCVRVYMLVCTGTQCIPVYVLVKIMYLH